MYPFKCTALMQKLVTQFLRNTQKYFIREQPIHHFECTALMQKLLTQFLRNTRKYFMREQIMSQVILSATSVP
jgi:hypothetical protein